MKPVATPILKWAGGKRKLVPRIAPAIAARLDETGGTYIEPFLGGGAVALALGRERAVVCDAIPELAAFYQTVRDEPAKVAWALSALACRGVDKDAYLSVRSETFDKPEFAAARVLYLNRLGYNGLWRVNQKGKYNVPYGRQPYRESVVKRRSRDAVTSLFPHKGKIEAVSDALAAAEILCGDFEPVINRAGPGDLVYADPPYDEQFNQYTAERFSELDQRRLAAALERATHRGAAVLASNSDTPLIREIYAWAVVESEDENRPINADKAGRGRVPCVLIVGRPR